MHLVKRLLKRGVYGYDRNALHPFELSMMNAILKVRSANLLFMSLQAQINEIVKFRSTHISGVPDWLNRRVDADCVVVEQSRFVGAEFGAPPLEPCPTFEILITLNNTQHCAAVFAVDQAIRSFTLSFPSIPDLYAAHVVDANLLGNIDESKYWIAKRGELGRIGAIAAEAISNYRYSKNVIVCPSKNYTSGKLFDIQLSKSYQKVLQFADGIRVNGLCIMGSIDKRNRIFEEMGTSYLRVGNDQSASYAYQIDGDATSDHLTRFKHQGAEADSLNFTLVDLLEQAIN